MTAVTQEISDTWDLKLIFNAVPSTSAASSAQPPLANQG